MKRALLATFLTVILIAASTVPAAAISQMFAFREYDDQYTGVESLMSAQDPNMSWDLDGDGFAEIQGNWSSGPVAITMWDQPGGFLEGGNQKLPINGQWVLRPYYSYCPQGGMCRSEHYDYITLFAGNYYKYTVYPTGALNTFNVRICRGADFSVCNFILENINMGRSTYRKAGTGGEGDCNAPDGRTGCAFGYSASRQNRFIWAQDGSQTWYSYCYTHPANQYNNVFFDGGRIGACGPFPNPDWTISYR